MLWLSQPAPPPPLRPESPTAIRRLMPATIKSHRRKFTHLFVVWIWLCVTTRRSAQHRSSEKHCLTITIWNSSPVSAGCFYRYLKRRRKLQTAGRSLWMTWPPRPRLQFQWWRRKKEWGTVAPGAGWTYAPLGHTETESRTAFGSSLYTENTSYSLWLPATSKIWEF